MALYEYACKHCGKTTTEMRKVDDRHLPATCEHCKKNAELIISGKAMLDFKGDGFYKPGKDVGNK